MSRPKPATFDKKKIVAENRRARFEYFLEEFFEAGIALTGTEVKSLRFGEGSIAEAYAEVKNGQVNGRAMEDVVAGLDISGATAAAVLANDPRVLEMAQLQMDVEQLTRAQSGWAQQRATQRVELNTMTQRQQFLAGRQDALIAIAAGVRPTDGDAFAFTTTDGRTTTSREEAGR